MIGLVVFCCCYFKVAIAPPQCDFHKKNRVLGLKFDSILNTFENK